MEILIILYLIIGIVHSLNKIGNPDRSKRPVWANDSSTSGAAMFFGFILIICIWPISMIVK